LAPSAAISIATPRPTPRPAPVTSTTFPSRIPIRRFSGCTPQVRRFRASNALSVAVVEAESDLFYYQGLEALRKSQGDQWIVQIDILAWKVSARLAQEKQAQGLAA
jgi:hypothetical protein